jgi:hypothetical protein
MYWFSSLPNQIYCWYSMHGKLYFSASITLIVLNILLAMVKKIFAGLLLLNSITCLAQEKLWTRQSKISEIMAFEKALDNRTQVLDYDITLSVETYPLIYKHSLAKPFLVLRPEIEYMPVYAQYFFSPGDSLVRMLFYDWEKNRFAGIQEKQKIWAAESKKLDKYSTEYERIRKILVKQIGNPVQTDLKPKEEMATRGAYYTRETIWDNEKLNGKLTMVFSEMIYRIRFEMYWK